METALARKVSKDKGNDTGKQIILTRPFKFGKSGFFLETALSRKVRKDKNPDNSIIQIPQKDQHYCHGSS